MRSRLLLCLILALCFSPSIASAKEESGNPLVSEDCINSVRSSLIAFNSEEGNRDSELLAQSIKEAGCISDTKLFQDSVEGRIQPEPFTGQCYDLANAAHHIFIPKEKTYLQRTKTLNRNLVPYAKETRRLKRKTSKKLKKYQQAKESSKKQRLLKKYKRVRNKKLLAEEKTKTVTQNFWSVFREELTRDGYAYLAIRYVMYENLCIDDNNKIPPVSQVFNRYKNVLDQGRQAVYDDLVRES